MRHYRRDRAWPRELRAYLQSPSRPKRARLSLSLSLSSLLVVMESASYLAANALQCRAGDTFGSRGLSNVATRSLRSGKEFLLCVYVTLMSANRARVP